MTEENVTGIMVYYYYVCKRKLWYYIHEIRMEHDNQNVKLGKLLDETAYARDNKHVMIDGVINVDFIKGNNVIHEIKKSKSIEEAGIMQVKYYLYYLYKKGLCDMTAKIDYPLIRQSISVELCDDDFTNLDKVVKDIVTIADMDHAFEAGKKTICKKCAYYDLCYI
ncbi:MAG: CRISPR-associated protein Cas4 [Clostridium sp.]|nr:CRISPR-associated protein Cas4 [Clostridium sp.]MCM1288319.1 CRISPR-associated protein Cas4 [Clostridium sp.]